MSVNHSTVVRVSTLSAVTLFLISGLAATAFAQQSGEDDRNIEFGVEVAVEDNDNVTLASGLEGSPGFEVVRDDIVTIVRPQFSLETPANEAYKLGVGALGEFRQGADTDLDETNLVANAFAEVNFSGGLSLSLHDDYYNSEFDQSVFFSTLDPSSALAGVNESTSNEIGAAIDFRPRERLAFTLEATHRDHEYTFTTRAPEDRDSDRLHARVAVPVSKTWVAFVDGVHFEEESDILLDINHEQEELVVGLEWVGRNDSSRIWFQAGTGEVDFTSTAGLEFDTTIWELGSDLPFSERTLMRLSFGRSAFDTTNFDLVFDMKDQEGTGGFQVYARKMARSSISTSSPDRFFTAEISGAEWRRRFAHRYDLSLRTNFLQIDSGSGENRQDDTSWVYRARVDYLFNDNFKLGFYALQSERDSLRGFDEFENTRIGVVLGMQN